MQSIKTLRNARNGRRAKKRSGKAYKSVRLAMSGNKLRNYEIECDKDIVTIEVWAAIDEIHNILDKAVAYAQQLCPESLGERRMRILIEVEKEEEVPRIKIETNKDRLVEAVNHVKDMIRYVATS